MTVKVSVSFESITYTLDLVQQLRDKGYVQGVDFDFAFHQSKWDEMIGEIPKHTEFIFYKEELATWFSLVHQ